MNHRQLKKAEEKQRVEAERTMAALGDQPLTEKEKRLRPRLTHRERRALEAKKAN